MIDLSGPLLLPEERDRLRHPIVGGVILFSRNYRSLQDLCTLTADIRSLRTPELLIAVDHEGGRVQRFREGFTPIPPMRSLGELWEKDRELAKKESFRLGKTLASELLASGIDLSFTPVVDLDYGTSSVIGDRAFHRDAQVVAELAGALIRGLHAAGMPAVAKHFPGHGYVAADSHVDVPVDDRPFEQIWSNDLTVFANLASKHLLDAVMPAHVIYPAVDGVPAGFSRIWLQQILRGKLGFNGIIFSDDLSMAGAHVAGDVVARAQAATEAGCDMVLVCNERSLTDELLDSWIVSAAYWEAAPALESMRAYRNQAVDRG